MPFPIGKKKQNRVRLQRPKRDLETQTPTALNLGSEDSQLRGAYTLHVCCDPRLLRRGLAAAVKCYMRKTRFFLV